MKKISLSVLGEKFEIGMEEEFFEFAKEDLLAIQNPTPKELLFLILKKNKECYKLKEDIQKLTEKIEEAI
ncbi:MAG: hypothetical protein GXO62_07440 [Epsilonproteobacteria bacterium]|nr:hypothetical protein [Campylobacterota bacterium]